MRAWWVSVVLGTALLFGCSRAPQQRAAPAKATPDPAIVAKLQQIVQIREQLLNEQQRKYQAGVVAEDGEAEVENRGNQSWQYRNCAR